MAKLRITQDDINASTPPSNGWGLFKIGAYAEEKKAGENGKPDTWKYSWRLELVKHSDPAKAGEAGRTFPATFYSNGMGFMLPFVSAVLDRQITEEMEFDPEGFAGKMVLGEIVEEPYQGRQIKKFKNFASAAECPF